MRPQRQFTICIVSRCAENCGIQRQNPPGRWQGVFQVHGIAQCAVRQFYLEYPHLISETASRNFDLPAISETVSRKSDEIDSAGAWQPGMLNLNLSWSHYGGLLRVTRPNARAFYEIEAINNTWPVRELSRQISSQLFDRLA